MRYGSTITDRCFGGARNNTDAVQPSGHQNATFGSFIDITVNFGVISLIFACCQIDGTEAK